MKDERAGLEVRLFGHPSVSADGVPVKFAKQATSLAMLAIVILQRGRPISREALAYTLFSDDTESAALGELRRYLSLAAKALPARAGQPWLIVDSENVRWNVDAGAFIDVIEFERCVGDDEQREHAIALYRGDLLQDNYDDWVVAEREKLRRTYLAALDAEVARHRGARDFGRATAAARLALAADPWREDIVRQLIAVRYESGDSAGALAEYEQFAKRLRDELNVAPMPETVAVRQAILRNDRVPGSFEPVPDDARGTSTRVSAPVLPFVGRRDELASLRGWWGRAARGRGTFALLLGEAGVGKTRLASEVARIVQAEGGRVFVGTTASPEAAPYQPLVEVLRSALPLIMARPPAAARRTALARILPDLRDPKESETTAVEPSAEREAARLYDAFADVLRRLASPRPLMLILEDLHWAGAATIDALAAVVRELAGAPVFIVGTCRSEEMGPDHPVRAFVRALRVYHDVDEVPVERLTQGDVAELVAALPAVQEDAGRWARRLFEHTEGNALFLNEAINDLEQLEAEEPVPRSIASIIAARTAQLSEPARTVAEIAAVAGAGCTVEMVCDVSNLPAASVALGFEELLDRRLLREAGVRAGFDYVFTHHLIGDAMYEGIEPAFRAQRHLRMARYLQSRSPEPELADSRQIARHFERAGHALDAARWYAISARRSMAVYAYGDAIALTDRALAGSVPPSLRRELLDVRERAHGQRGDRAGQQADIAELDELAGDDAQARFDVLVRRILLARSLGETEEEGQLIARLRELAGGLGDAAVAQALRHEATHAGGRSRKTEGREPAREALAIYERLGDVRGQLECLYLLVDFATNTGDLDAAAQHLRRMRELAATLGDRAVDVRTLGVAAVNALLRQQYRECFELSNAQLAATLATNDREAEASARGRIAVTAAWLGEFDVALQEFAQALKSYEAIGHKRGLATTYTNQAMLLMRLGLLDEALASIDRSDALLPVVGEQRMAVANAVNASFVAVLKGDASRAKSLATAALAAAKEIAFPVFEAGALANLANAELQLGAVTEALSHMEEGLAIRRAIQAPSDFVDDLADLTLAHVQAGNAAAARASAEEILALGPGGLSGSFWPHYVMWAASEGLRSAGDRERSEAIAEDARNRLHDFARSIGEEHARGALLALPQTRRIAGN